jgi:DNA-binding NarL/FixJ family response regulator
VNLNGDKNGADRPSVVIGANEPATLAGMRMALEADGLEVSGEVHSLQELVEAVERLEPDVCLLDIDLTGGGIRAAAEVGARAPAVPVVLLADDTGNDRFLEAIRVGVAGYVPKRIAADRLPSVIRAVIAGEPAIPRALVTLLIDQYRDRPARRQLPLSHRHGVDLTSREWEVLDFMRAGLSTREIADRLLISEVTVRRHIGSVLKKLHVTSRADALQLLESA